ncbi:MAG: rod shape-determining protein MreC [Candidatus Omnitrophota bacterium]|jgi:rod shape-determining protein MreC
MRSRPSYVLLAILILPVLFLLQKPAMTEPVRKYSLAILKPALVITEAVTDALSNLMNGFSNFWETFQDYGVLKAKIAVLESELLRFEEVEKENGRLKKLLEFKTLLNGKSVPCRIIGWDSSPWRRIVFLDKGARQGVVENMAVVVPEGLVGRVMEVGPETAKVLLLPDPDSRVSTLTTTSRTHGMAAGDGSLKLQLKYLDLESEATVDETVMTSGVGGIYPKGIRIGKIVSIARDRSGLHLVGTVEPFAPFSKLEEVLCVMRYPAE